MLAASSWAGAGAVEGPAGTKALRRGSTCSTRSPSASDGTTQSPDRDGAVLRGRRTGPRSGGDAARTGASDPADAPAARPTGCGRPRFVPRVASEPGRPSSGATVGAARRAGGDTRRSPGVEPLAATGQRSVRSATFRALPDGSARARPALTGLSVPLTLSGDGPSPRHRRVAGQGQDHRPLPGRRLRRPRLGGAHRRPARARASASTSRTASSPRTS